MESDTRSTAVGSSVIWWPFNQYGFIHNYRLSCHGLSAPLVSKSNDTAAELTWPRGCPSGFVSVLYWRGQLSTQSVQNRLSGT